MLDLAAHDVQAGERDIVVRQYDAAGNIGGASNHLDVTVAGAIQPEESIMSSVVPYFTSGNQFSLTLNATPYAIVSDMQHGMNGMTDPFLLTMHGYNDLPGYSHYLNGMDFMLDGNTLMLMMGTVPLDAYMVDWNKDVFHTDAPSGQGYVAPMTMLFAAGMGSNVTVNGVTIDNYKAANEQSTTVDSGGHNTMFVVHEGTSAVINTNDGMDVVQGNSNATMTFLYDRFANSAQDLIFGFNKTTDTIMLDGAAVTAVDTDHDGKLSIKTVDSSSSEFTLDKSFELISFTQGGMLATDLKGPDAQLTLNTLNQAFTDNKMTAGDHVLLLAQSANDADEAMLLYYNEKVGNGFIDQEDLTIVATFSQGAPDANSIHLIGVAGGE